MLLRIMSLDIDTLSPVYQLQLPKEIREVTLHPRFLA